MLRSSRTNLTFKGKSEQMTSKIFYKGVHDCDGNCSVLLRTRKNRTMLSPPLYISSDKHSNRFMLWTEAKTVTNLAG